jgi:predicted enzyme related to lactoylglutathione lyase
MAAMQFLVNLDVGDLDKAIRFYSEAFDLRIGRRFDFGVEMLGGPTSIYLLDKCPGTTVSSLTSQHRNYARHWTPLHLDFVVDDIDAAVRKALDAGAKLEQDISTYVWGKLALMADPFGHGFCFVQFLGSGYDEIAL